MLELFCMVYALVRPGDLPAILGWKEHGCPCSACMQAQRNGKSPRSGHWCPCEDCQKKRINQ